MRNHHTIRNIKTIKKQNKVPRNRTDKIIKQNALFNSCTGVVSLKKEIKANIAFLTR